MGNNNIHNEVNKAHTNQINDDSKTKVYQRLHGKRTVVSIRCKPELKDALKRFCKAKGLSICHIFEGLVTAFLIGVHEQIELVNQSPTIDLTLVRDVKRLRRYAVEKVGKCRVFYCNKSGTEHLIEVSTGEHWDFCKEHSILPLKKGFEKDFDG